jgi:hypothetical protein
MRVAKRVVSVAKGQAYDGLYQRLGTKEREKDIYRMARIRERKTRDINQIKCIKDGTDRLLVKDERSRTDGESTSTSCLMGRMRVLPLSWTTHLTIPTDAL